MTKNMSSTTQSQHQKQVMYQIWLPFVIGVILVLLLCTLTVVSTTNHSIESVKLASISLVLLILPVLVASVIVIALLGALIFGVYKLTQIVPYYSLKTQAFFTLISSYSRVWMDRVTQPVLSMHGWISGIERFFSYFVKQPK